MLPAMKRAASLAQIGQGRLQGGRHQIAVGLQRRGAVRVGGGIDQAGRPDRPYGQLMHAGPTYGSMIACDTPIAVGKISCENPAVIT